MKLTKDQQIANLEREIKDLTARLKYIEEDRDDAKRDAKDWKEMYDTVIERADVQHDYDKIAQCLSEYQCYGWTDRLDLALRMTR